ncbi:dnaJ homolog subfamily C member 16-like [Hylaeus volcanicus]|uniref:dnaJ homolog subfamily C member 16-like n=1 Tax=Hylaeus volcanicus TaxID=313075 RepID=UPI0023B85A73|nr:dnaJ homolog subfamily C member 16-like [Hylaeus volcanicus]
MIDLNHSCSSAFFKGNCCQLSDSVNSLKEEKTKCSTFRLWFPQYVKVILFLLVVDCIFLGTTAASIQSRDFYKILKVPRNADISLIKKNYRKLSKELHPDTNPNSPPQAFIDVRDAHEALSDPKLRKLYDKYGEEGLNPNFQPNQYSKSYSDHPFHFFQENTGNTFFFNSHPGQGDFQSFFFSEGPQFEREPVVKDLYEKSGSHVVKIKSHTWKSIVHEREWFVLVNFYGPSCSHCVKLESTYESIAASFKDILVVAAVNCEKERRLCHSSRIESFPTVKIYSDSFEEPVQTYDGNSFSVKSLKKWLSDHIKLYGDILTNSNWNSWIVSNSHLPKLIFITPNHLVPLWFRKAVFPYKKRLSLGYITLKHAACQQLANQHLPRSMYQNLVTPILLRITDIDTVSGEIIPIKTSSTSIVSLTLNRIAASNDQYYREMYETTLNELTKLKYARGDCSPNESKICLLLFLPHDKYNTSKPAIALQEALLKYPKVAKRFWISSSKQPQLLNAFSLSPFPKSCLTSNVPVCLNPSLDLNLDVKKEKNCNLVPTSLDEACYTLIAFKPKRKKFLVMKKTNSSTESEIHNFLDAVLNQGVPLVNLLKSHLNFV